MDLVLLQLLFLVLRDEGFRVVSRFLIIFMGKEYLSRSRNVRKSEDLHRRGGPCLLHPSALVVDHGAHLAVACSRGNEVSHMERTLLHQNGGYGAASLIQLRLDHKSSGHPVRIGLQLQDLRRQQDHLKQLADALSGLRGYGSEHGASAPFLRNELIFRKLLLHPVDICVGLIDLVHRDDDLDPRRSGMADGLHGLGHHAVVRRHHQNRDIRGVGSPHTHGRKRFVSGRIQEGDLLSVDLNGIGADMLGNAAGLLIRHIGLTDGVKERGLAMVNVSHDADNGRSGNHILLVLLILLQKLLDHIDLDFLLADDVVFNWQCSPLPHRRSPDSASRSCLPGTAS